MNCPFSVPPKYGRRFENLANTNFESCRKQCPAYLRHKANVISTDALKSNAIPFNTIVQKAIKKQKLFFPRW